MSNYKFNDDFRLAKPGTELFPHYNSLRNSSGLSAFGIQMIVNSSGTEYRFIPLSEFADDEDIPYETRETCQDIISADIISGYDLWEKADEMRKLFHVNSNSFDMRHDRECEIDEGYLHKAYMFSALRSFAWTLADYCKRDDITPEDIDVSLANQIADFVADEEWLNYDGDSYCHGLCGGSDLHVFFVPDAAMDIVANILPDEEDYERVRSMKERFPTYREILEEAHSLDELRNDLEYIYPAILTLWNGLRKNRDYDEELTGNSADIVYAWCSLAKAAKEPFFSEDGPTTCRFNPMLSEGINIALLGIHEDSLTFSNDVRAAKEYDTKSNIENISDAKGITQSSPEEFEIDSDGVLTKYNGCAEEVIIPKGVIQIGDESFKFNFNIKSLVVPEGVETIGDSAFNVCHNLTNITLPTTIRSIGKFAFAHSGVKNISMPEGIKIIGKCAFWLCKQLESIDLPNSIEELGDSAFDASGLVRVVIPDGCKKIGAGCFSLCEGLEDIYLPSEDVEIGSGAFQTLSAVKIHVSSRNTQGNTADDFDVNSEGVLLKYTGSCEIVTIPDGVKRIEKDAFKNNISFNTLVIPEGVEKIDSEAFEGIPNLKHITLPSTLHCIEKMTFADSGIQEVVIPKGVETIGSLAFCACYQLKAIILPTTIKEIDNSAFSASGLLSISIPNGCKKIGFNCFENCRDLKDVYIPDPAMMDEIGSSAFNTMNPDTEFHIVSCNDVGTPPKEFEIDSDGVLIKYNGCSKEVVIPDGVIRIKKDAFKNNFFITTLIVPEGVQKIDEAMFNERDNLTMVTLPSSLQSIEEETFAGTGIKNISIPEGIEIIGGCAFSGCEQLENIKLPSTLKEIGNGAFQLCEQMKAVELPKSLKKLGTFAFQQTALTSVVIPDGCEEIGMYCFCFCRDLEDIYIPASVKEIGPRALATQSSETRIHVSPGGPSQEMIDKARV